jgi:predicted dehydrogenase
MMRLALVSAATYGQQDRTPGSYHGTAFATACNGFHESAAAAHEWTFVRCGRRLPDVRVTKIWDPERLWAERLAAACDIDQVCDSPEETAHGVDAVIVVDDGSRAQWRLALPALAAGLPTFIDKPLAMNPAEAGQAIAAAEAGRAKLMSASSLRYVPDIQALKAEAAEIGPIPLATAACGNELVYYGIHALEMAYEVIGAEQRGRAESAFNVGRPDRNACRVRFSGGLDLVLLVAQPQYMQPGYALSLYGKGGWRLVQPRLDDLYVYLLERFLAMARGGEQPVSNAEMQEVIAVLAAGERSLVSGREEAVTF